jgi:hypothetical protein
MKFDQDVREGAMCTVRQTGESIPSFGEMKRCGWPR